MKTSRFKSVIEKVKLIIVGCGGLLALFSGAFYFSSEQALDLYKNTQIIFLSVGFLLFLVSLLMMIVRLRRVTVDRRQLLLFLGLAASGTLFLFFPEDTGFKIIDDEVVVAGVAQQMYLNGETALPMQASMIEGQWTVTGNRVDKRGALLSYFICILHYLIGYNAGNCFLLNFLLTPILILLVALAGQRLGGNLGAIIASILLISIPQLSRSINGCGLEVINLVMIMSVLLLAGAYLKNPRDSTGSALVSATCLLAYARYESILFVLFTGILLITIWIQRRIIQCPTAALFAPFLLIPYLWLNSIYSVNPDSWQLFMRENTNSAFSTTYLWSNLGAALRHFFDFGVTQPNSLLVILAGIICFALLVQSVWRNPPRGEHSSLFWIVIGSIPVFSLFLVIILSFSYGQFDRPITQRLSLPFYLIFVLIVTTVVSRSGVPRRIQYGFVGLSLFYLLVHTLPTNLAHVYSRSYMPAQGTGWARQFIEEVPHKNIVMVTNLPALWILDEVESMSNSTAIMEKDRLRQMLLSEPEKNLFHFRRFALNGDSKLHNLDASWLDESFILQSLMVQKLGPNSFVQVCRITEIKPNE